VASKWRLAGELAVVGVLATATTLALAVTSDEAPHRSGVPLIAVGAAPVHGPSAAAPESFPLPAVPVVRRGASASSGRSVGKSAWRTALYEPAARGVDDIPMRALEAYQRAAMVIDLADDSCHLDWSLLAAIAKVESDHGQYAGASINSDGRVRPFILGPRLTGSSHTRRMTDTDAGRLDGDRRVDRALGPFQILPSTWAQVRVDADGDGRRDPNDVDDAALAAAVFLCSGREDLATGHGQRLAVLRYNPDGGYARLVMDVMAGYELAAGNLVVQARVTGGAVPFSPALTPPSGSADHDASFAEADSPSWSGTTPTSAPATPSPTSTSASPSPTPAPTPTPTPAPTPTPTPTETPSPSDTPSASPSDSPSDSPTASASPGDDPESTPVPVDDTEGTGAPLVTGLSLTMPGCVPLLWLLRRRRHPDAEPD